MTLSINIFSPHASKLLVGLLSACKRCNDRGCCKGIKKNPRDLNDQAVNTKLSTQQELETLYTGP